MDALDDDDDNDAGVLDAVNLFLQLQKRKQERDNKCIHQNVLRNLYQ